MGGGGVLEDITELEAERTRLYQELSRTGDLRRGTITATHRRCGKANCACANPEHPGHGPRYMLTRTVAGKTQAIHLRPGPELRKAEREVENYHNFNSLVHTIVDLNERICDARPVEEISLPSEMEMQKKTSSAKSRKNSPSR